ncbi:MAG: sensor histidine kinase [Candidatus Longimicrobiales bacterium M2_2A_002]
MRSLRLSVALRLAAVMTLALAVLSVAVVLSMREFLDRELNANLLNVASIQAAALTDDPSGVMRFHEWELTPEEATQIRELNRFAQVWSADGESLLRSQFLTRDLPLDTTALQRASAGNLVIEEQEHLGMPIRSLFYPLERLGPLHAHHVLQVAAPLQGRNEIVGRLARVLAVMTVLLGLATFGGGWWLARRMVKPVNEIIDQAESVEAQTLDRRIDAHADLREYQRLVGVLNTMLGRLDRAFEAQRRFTADASHELRGPLTALRGEVELALRRDREEEEYRRVLASNLQEIERLSQLAEDLLTLARSDAGVMQPRLLRTDVLERAENVFRRLQRKAADKDVTLALEPRGDTEALVDPGLTDQLIWNLVDNAVKFTPTGGEVTVEVDGRDDAVEVRVADTGPGLPPSELGRIFDRFYRADESRTHHDEMSGTGLGLSIVRAIVEVHGGTVVALNRPDGGAEFIARLPRTP